MFMRTVIIENEYDVPEELQAFIDENPDTLGEIDLQIGARYRPVEDLAQYILQADAVALSSTFLYKDQLENFVKAFAVGPLSHRPLKFYVYSVTYRMNEWNEKREDGSYLNEFQFDDMDTFINNLKRLLQVHEVYSIEEDYQLPQDQPGFSYFGGATTRARLKAFRVSYIPERDLFYSENDGDVKD